jgi:hypothetical protein
MHDPSPLCPREPTALLLADRLQRTSGQAQHVELVDDDGGVGKHGMDGLVVGPPPIHGHEFHPFVVSQALQERDHTRPVPIAEQIEDDPLLHVGEHAPGPAAEMDLVDAEPVRCDERARRIQGLGVLGEDAPNRALS